MYWIYTAIIISVFGGYVGPTGSDWYYWFCIISVAFCGAMAQYEYQKLEKRISELEKKYTEGEL